MLRRATRLRVPLARASKGQTSYDKGQALEARVEELFRNLGWKHVERNVRVKDERGLWSELDVVAGRWFKIYIECKNFDKPIPLEEVAKFKEVLRLNSIPLWRGLFVTAGTYGPRSTYTGVRTWDGEQLERWESRAAVISFLRRSYRRIFKMLIWLCVLAWSFPAFLRIKQFRDWLREVDPAGRFEDTLAWIRELGRRGFVVVKQYAPIVERWQARATAEVDRLRRRWRETEPLHGATAKDKLDDATARAKDWWKRRTER